MEDFYKQIEQVNEISYKEELFVVEDIESIITQDIFKSLNIYVLVKDFLKRNLLSSLSVAKNKNKITRFNSTENLIKHLKDKGIKYPVCIEERYDLKIYNGNDYPISLIIEGERHDIPNSIFDDLLYSLWDIVSETINYENLSNDYNHRKIENLRKEIDTTTDFEWKDLCGFISKEEKIEIEYFMISPQKEIQKKKCQKNFLLSENFETQDEYKTYYKESISTGKPIAFFDNKTNNYIAFIPAIERYLTPKFIKGILIIWSEYRIKRYSISNIKNYIDCFIRRQDNLQKTSFSAKIQADVLKKFNGKGYANKNELLSDFRFFSEKCLSEIIKSTYAYSAAVRLYNPSKNALAMFTIECNEWGEYNGCEIKGKKDIKTKLHHCSVNAFAFKNATCLKEPYVYINNINIKSIPQKYKELGLDSIMPLREKSKSEICFPLFIGKVPFGVLNIESPIINAFDNDTHYLLSIKQAIESFYDISMKITDSNWLAARSPVYKNVHEIKQLLDTKDFFTEKQLSALKPLILYERNVLNNEEKELNDLKEEIKQYLNEKINILEKIKLIHWNIEGTILVNNNIFLKIKLIVFNLIENILNHSEIRKDAINFSINSVKNKVSTLKIKVITFGAFGEDDFHFLTFSPILKGETYHYGMFLIGMLSRNLGGTCYIEKMTKNKKRFTIIEVIIPLN